MSNILVPIDFSKTSDNAVDYAIELAIQIKSKLVVLQHVLQPVVVTDALYTINAEDVLAYKKDVEVKLQEYALMVKEKCNRNIEILTEIGAGNLENEVANCCLKNDIAFVVMGITGASELEAKLIGSNTLNVSESIENPLFIVPPQYKFKHISKALLLTDYENTNENLPMKAFTYLLDSLNPILDVVHIANAPKSDSFEASAEKFELKNLLENYSPTFKVKYSDDFVFAVNEMVLENNYQLLICIYQQKNWLQKFLGKSHTHQLAFNAKVPLLILHK